MKKKKVKSIFGKVKNVGMIVELVDLKFWKKIVDVIIDNKGEQKFVKTDQTNRSFKTNR